jgi:hypothetical protein
MCSMATKMNFFSAVHRFTIQVSSGNRRVETDHPHAGGENRFGVTLTRSNYGPSPRGGENS